MAGVKRTTAFIVLHDDEFGLSSHLFQVECQGTCWSGFNRVLPGAQFDCKTIKTCRF